MPWTGLPPLQLPGVRQTPPPPPSALGGMVVSRADVSFRYRVEGAVCNRHSLSRTCPIACFRYFWSRFAGERLFDRSHLQLCVFSHLVAGERGDLGEAAAFAGGRLGEDDERDAEL